MSRALAAIAAVALLGVSPFYDGGESEIVPAVDAPPGEITSWYGPLTNSLDCYPDTCSITRATSAWCEQSDGQFTEATSGNACFGRYGLSAAGAVTNYVGNSLDASAQTLVGTPTDCLAGTPANCNSTSGAFSTYAGGAEADTIGDDDAASLEGMESLTAGTATGDYTVSAFLSEGTLTDYTLEISTDGTGGTTCTGTTLAASTERYWCTATVGGTPTFVKGRVLVGDAATDTGTIIVSQWQFEPGGLPGRPCVCTTASACVCNADQTTTPHDSIPGLHRACFSYTPRVSSNTLSRTFYDSRSGSGASGTALITLGTGALRFIAHDGTSPASADSIALSWVGGTTYLICSGYDGAIAFVERDGARWEQSVSIGAVSHTYTNMRIGWYSSNLAEGSISHLRFYP